MDILRSDLVKKYRVILLISFAVILVIGLFVGWLIGYLPQKKLQNELDTIKDNYSTLEKDFESLTYNYESLEFNYESLESAYNQLVEQYEPSKSEKMPFYEYYTNFFSLDIPVLEMVLGKGDKFSAYMEIYEADMKKHEITEPRVDGSFVFYVRSPTGQKIVDGGRVVGEYAFAFTAEESGKYTLVIDDRDEKCYIVIHYNSPARLWDIY